MLAVCKECFEKKYGKMSELIFYESDVEGICFLCGKKRKMIGQKYIDKNQGYFIIH